MFQKLKENVKKREYELFLNKKNLKIKTRWISSIKDYYIFLIRELENVEDVGFFIYNEKNFASFGLMENIDIVFVDWDNKVIHIEEDFKTNKISIDIDKPKFIYIFKSGTVKKKRILMNDILSHVYKR